MLRPFVAIQFLCSLFLVVVALVSSAEEPKATPARETALSGAATVAYTTSMTVLDDRRRLGVGDRVSFRVVEDRKEPVTLVVTDSGEMEVPLIGRVVAANRTCKQLAFAIKEPLDRTYFYNATVIVGLDSVSVRSKGRIYVTGQVRSQGALDIPPDENFTLSKAILRAGGLADFANKKKVRLIRKTGLKGDQTETITVNLEEILERGRIEQDPVLRPDDMIVVPERLVNF